MLKRIELLLNSQVYFVDLRSDFLLINIGKQLSSDLFQILKNSSFFKLSQLLDIFVVDYPEEEKRFQINYSLISLIYKRRIYLRICENENSDINLLSMKRVFASAYQIDLQ